MAQSTTEEQLRKAKLENAKLLDAQRKAKAKARRAKADSVAFPGAHRGY
jgi:hypothetical protein